MERLRKEFHIVQFYNKMVLYRTMNTKGTLSTIKETLFSETDGCKNFSRTMAATPRKLSKISTRPWCNYY